MESDLELLSIGDATIDVFMSPIETETLCDIDSKECKICFSYGDKIPVRNMEFSIGGNAANNSVGTRRLGVKSAIVLTIGDDPVGNMIVNRLGQEGVNLSYVVQQPKTTSNYSSIISYGGERTIFTYHAPRSYEFPVKLPVVPWVYLTSMGESFRPFYNHLLEWLTKNPTVKLAFNPGSWQMRAGITAVSDILKRTHMLYVNREEGEKLTNFGESAGKERELMQALSRLGPKIVIVTDGANGSFAFNGQLYVKVATLPVEAFERTGAGDSFGAGCIAALIKGKDLGEALLWGTVNSASVIGYTGSQRGLLKEDEMPVWLDRAKTSGVIINQF